MSQCITCQWTLMRDQPRGKGKCYRDVSTDPLDVLAERKCSMYRLAPMEQVRSRSRRQMKFDEQGKARIE
ncbi:MAG TPA: hypothetical protein VIY48_01045 [Candidatus Paceibacterota bacterium]